MKTVRVAHRAVPAAGAIGVGSDSLRMSRQAAGARARLVEKGLHELDTALGEFAWAAERTLFERWSGSPVALRLIHYAREFARLLPVTVAVPAPTADDQGLLAFEWTGSNARRLIVTIAEDGMLVYSGRLGPRRRISGAEPLAGHLPAPIRQALYDVIG
ncbi:MAG: hypothetical protein DWB43_09960 [Lautropia sp.]|jgi:hypothetical protein|nr:hypothetical protein [Lautropia sp.]MCL4703247.1 hypothetical protein [Burkholderiaceae bacterium]MCZ2415422.1 hypothetical protein [Burkholderiales bacterium]MDL1908248.1 hypothetical protein [Betaproteobacteria bacterium PRO1]MEB2335712.1 hypothetical protein [Burkholderiales bacterium]